jgi:magnesium-transporting ATPase (P-type)
VTNIWRQPSGETIAVAKGARWVGLDPIDDRTLTFTTLITTNLALIFANRSLTRAFAAAWFAPNPAMWSLITTALLLLAAVLFVPPIRELFQLARPHWDDLAVCAIAAATAVVLIDVSRCWRPEYHERRRAGLTGPPFQHCASAVPAATDSSSRRLRMPG